MGADVIPAETIIWAAGVAASPLGATLGAQIDRAGRVLVEPDLTVPGSRNVFVIGDLASLAGADGKPLPGRGAGRDSDGEARGAERHARRGGTALPAVRLQGSRQHGDHRPRVSRRRLGWLRLKGYIGWLAWLFVHILNLIGFRNRLVVLVQWAWSYFSYQRAIRLITGPLPDAEPGRPPDQPPLKLRRSAEASAKAEGAKR